MSTTSRHGAGVHRVPASASSSSSSSSSAAAGSSAVSSTFTADSKALMAKVKAKHATLTGWITSKAPWASFNAPFWAEPAHVSNLIDHDFDAPLSTKTNCIWGWMSDYVSKKPGVGSDTRYSMSLVRTADFLSFENKKKRKEGERPQTIAMICPAMVPDTAFVGLLGNWEQDASEAKEKQGWTSKRLNAEYKISFDGYAYDKRSADPEDRLGRDMFYTFTEDAMWLIQRRAMSFVVANQAKFMCPMLKTAIQLYPDDYQSQCQYMLDHSNRLMPRREANLKYDLSMYIDPTGRVIGTERLFASKKVHGGPRKAEKQYKAGKPAIAAVEYPEAVKKSLAVLNSEEPDKYWYQRCMAYKYKYNSRTKRADRCLMAITDVPCTTDSVVVPVINLEMYLSSTQQVASGGRLGYQEHTVVKVEIDKKRPPFQASRETVAPPITFEDTAAMEGWSLDLDESERECKSSDDSASDSNSSSDSNGKRKDLSDSSGSDSKEHSAPKRQKTSATESKAVETPTPTHSPAHTSVTATAKPSTSAPTATPTPGVTPATAAPTRQPSKTAKAAAVTKSTTATPTSTQAPAATTTATKAKTAAPTPSSKKKQQAPPPPTPDSDDFEEEDYNLESK